VEYREKAGNGKSNGCAKQMERSKKTDEEIGGASRIFRCEGGFPNRKRTSNLE